MIRRAKLSDSTALRRLVKRAWKKAHPSLEVNEDKLLKITHKYMSNPQCVVFVSDVDGVKGLLVASISPLEISDGKATTDHVFYCTSGEGDQLIETYIKWAQEKEAVMINMNVSSGVSQADSLIESCGFRRAGGVYFYE